MSARPVVLLLETETVVRHALAEYLRECGYQVVEAAATNEASEYLSSGEGSVDVALLDVRAAGDQDVFTLAQWIRAQHTADVVMIGGIESGAKKAGEICQAGPSLPRPYAHTSVLDLIKRLRAERERNRTPR